MVAIRSLVITLALATAFSVVASPAHASHFRGAHLTWTKIGPTTVRFHTVQEFKADDVTPLPINPGDGDPTITGPVTILFTGTDPNSESYRIIEFFADHTYSPGDPFLGLGPYTAFLGLEADSLNCCRLSSLSLLNASNSDYRIETVVDLHNANSGSPAGTIPPFASVPRIITLPAGAPGASVFFPISDPGGDPFTCALATSAQSGIPSLPPLLMISNAPGGCRFDWDTSAEVAGTKYAIQVQLNENHPGAAGRVALDFLLHLVPPDCGDNVVESPEDCDGTDDAACDGACRPPGGANECTCPICGDDIIDAGEQCDGTGGGVFGPCPGQCLTSMLNACNCPVCGDNETTIAVGEQCDGTDDGACPGRCLGDCSCAVCGDNVTEGPEQCDGTSDAACPGRCLGDCSCAVCGDNVTEGPEQCDGTSDAACPGRCLGDCTCAVCGDNVKEGPEQCDGSDSAACPGACLPNCVCALCGDNAVNAPGEQCDGTSDAACPGRCLGDCTCAVCGDNVKEGPEQCDGSDSAACPGACLPTCVCSICGDNIVSGPEQCDGANDAACPGLCRPPADSNECKCPVCGDGDANQPSEACDGADDAACPGDCTASCTCAVCGDNVIGAPAETCDGTNDAACPGQCRPPGGPNECHCPACGDNEVNQTGEQCDGTDAPTCPGECGPPNAGNACKCAVCGDGIVNRPSEECDGPATGMCTTGICQPDCTYATCGNCTLDPGETCDPPNGEICNNLIDDDGDGKLNCADTDCTPGRTCKHQNPTVNALVANLPCAGAVDCNGRCSHNVNVLCTTDADCSAMQAGSFCVAGAKCICPDTAAPFQTCGATCAQVFGCRCIDNDPARIRFGKTPTESLLKIHGRFRFDSAMDPPSDGFTLMMSNSSGQIVYRGTLQPGDLVGASGRYKFIDPAAKHGAGTRDGLYRVAVKLKKVHGVINYMFHVQAYGDFSLATSLMTTQVIAGDDTASLTGQWTQTNKGWKLIDFE